MTTTLIATAETIARRSRQKPGRRIRTSRMPSAQAGDSVAGVSLLTDHDIYLFKEGTHYRLYEKLGAHPMSVQGQAGVLFAVWAPNAASVSVIGDFNDWDPTRHPLFVRWDSSGIWEGFIPGVREGGLYKYHIVSKNNGYTVDKKDPFGFGTEGPPGTASKVVSLRRRWKDQLWMNRRHEKNSLSAPFNIYEMHLGSWRRVPEEGDRPLTYRETAHWLPPYLKEMGYTHVEFMPVMEHPFYGSWGYQITDYFAPTARYGSPHDFMELIDALHRNGIGVILDWVPSHFPADECGLAYFDGTHLFEYADPREGFHPDWRSCIFNLSRNEVRAFLISNALFWLDQYHVDGLRVDAVASMLYRDYSRNDGEWIPNVFGGRENLEAISFLQDCNKAVYAFYPDVQTIAEESTAWPGVSRPVHVGGLGFGMKWNMGWMHDTLEYMRKDPIHRKYHHNELTFSFLYTFSENYVLSLSHDEVVHGKGSLLNKMPGDTWQKFANLRLLLAYQAAHPGKKLMFMGGEFGQWNEWNHDQSLDWHLLEYAPHQGIQRLARDLNHLILREPALHERDFDPGGFEMIDAADWEQSVLVFLRKARERDDDIVIVCSFTPVVRTRYRIGVPRSGYWREIFNSDAKEYGGSGAGNLGGVGSQPVGFHRRFHSLVLTLPPLSVIMLKRDPDRSPM